MRKIKIYLELLEAFYGTPRNLKVIDCAYKLCIVAVYLIFFYLLLVLINEFFLQIIASIICIKISFWLIDKEAKVSKKISYLETKSYRKESEKEELLSSIMTYNMRWGRGGYEGGLKAAAENFTKNQLQTIRWEFIAGDTLLRGFNKYQLIQEVENLISQDKFKKEAAA